MYWAAPNPEEAATGDYPPRICRRGQDEYVIFLGLLAEDFDMRELELLHRGELLYTQAYCPEMTTGYESGWAAYQANPLDSADPAPSALGPEDIAIRVKILSKRCLGSLGATVFFRIQPTYRDAANVVGSYEVTYEVTGGTDPIVNTFEIKDNQVRYQNKEFASTPTCSPRLTAKVTHVAQK